MRRLLVTFLVAAALRSQHAVSAQCSPQCSCSSPDGSWSPLYRTLTSPPPSENDIVPRGPPRCSCGCSPRRLPPRQPAPPPNTAQQTYGISALSGVVMDSPVFQQVGPATVIQTPPAMLFQGNSPPTCDTSSHIMTIPRRQDSSVTFTSFDSPSNTFTTTDDAPPTVTTYETAPNARPAVIFSSTSDESPTTTYSTTPQHISCQPPPTNSVMPVPQPNFSSPPPPPPPQPMFFTQPAPLFASCPATLFYPATPAMTCPQQNFVYPPAPIPSYPSAPAVPTISHGFTSGSSSRTTYSTADNTPTTFSMTPSQNIPCDAPQPVPSNSQTFTSGTFQNTPTNTVTFSTSDVQQTPTNVNFNTNFQQIPTTTANLNTNFQQTPTNAVDINTNCQQTPANAVNSNNNFQQKPSNTIFFRDSDSTAGAGTLLPETTGPTVTTHDSPLTYTLLPSGTNNGVTDANRDCSVPVPPVLV